MFNKNKFTEYVTKIDQRVYDYLSIALDMDSKYRKHYKLQISRFLRRFDADDTDSKKALTEMCDFISQNNLLPNYFEGFDDVLCSHHHYHIPAKDFVVPFLVWNTFNESAHLQVRNIKKKPYLQVAFAKHIDHVSVR